MITTLNKGRYYMKYFRLPECFENEEFCGLRQTTRDERIEWTKNRIENGESIHDCTGEPLLAPSIKWVPLNGQTWQVIASRANVPFTDYSSPRYDFKFKGFGLVQNLRSGEQLFVRSDIIKKCLNPAK